MTMDHPEILLLLWPAVLLGAGWAALAAWRQRRTRRFASPRMQRRLLPPAGRGQIAGVALLTGALVLGLVAAAGPRWGGAPRAVRIRSRDVVVVLDVSRSMLARDLKPSRLERARADLVDLCRELSTERVALVCVRNGARLLCPLTRDHRFFLQALEHAGPHAAPPGETRLGAGIVRALDALPADRPAPAAILLLSDGEDLANTLPAAAREAAAREVPVFTVAYGAAEGAPIPDAATPGGFMIREGGRVISRVRPAALSALARATGGTAVAPDDTAAHAFGESVLRLLSGIDRAALTLENQPQPTVRFQWFLFPGVALALAAAWLAAGPRAAAMLLAGACLSAPTASGAARGGPDAGESRPPAETDPSAAYADARERFAAGRYRAAAERLTDLETAGAADRARVETARGCALFRAAEQVPAGTVTGRLERVRLLEEAAGAFLAGLRADPAYGPARTNLVVAFARWREERRPPEPPPPPRAAPPAEPRNGEIPPPEPGRDRPPPEFEPEPGAPRRAATEPVRRREGRLTDTEVEAILQQAARREQEHAARRRARAAQRRPRREERDW